MLFDLGPHMIHQTLLLFGIPSFVTSTTAKQRINSEVDDFFSLIFTFENRPKLICQLEAGVLFSHSDEFGERTFFVYGENGSFVKRFGGDIQEEQLKNKQIFPGSEKWGKDEKETFGVRKLIGEKNHTVVETECGDYLKYYQNLHDSIPGIRFVHHQGAH